MRSPRGRRASSSLGVGNLTSKNSGIFVSFGNYSSPPRLSNTLSISRRYPRIFEKLLSTKTRFALLMMQEKLATAEVQAWFWDHQEKLQIYLVRVEDMLCASVVLCGGRTRHGHGAV